jgi:hypothetical protein
MSAAFLSGCAHSGATADDQQAFIQHGNDYGYVDEQGHWLYKETFTAEENLAIYIERLDNLYEENLLAQEFENPSIEA